MGTLADSLFTVLMSWVRALVTGLWALFSSDHTTILEFLGRHWVMIALVIIAAGLVIDWIIWLLRWQPYHLWAQRARRLLRIEEPEEEEEEKRGRARAAVSRGRSYAPPVRETDTQDDAFPPPALVVDEAQAQEAITYANSAPDERAYPGMRYDSPAAGQGGLNDTHRYAAVRSEGPGAAEVERRRAEIDAWQQQMQEEARAQAEQARIAQEEYEAEQARLAQEQYERELAEYERQKAQYELELAEYERQKAEYDAYMARQAAEEAAQSQSMPAASMTGTPRRRRAAGRTYSDYVEGEDVSELPDPPAWPQMETAKASAERQAAAQPESKKGAQGGLLGRMARMIEPEEEELAARKTLPPRVDPRDAYRPAKTPQKKR